METATVGNETKSQNLAPQPALEPQPKPAPPDAGERPKGSPRSKILRVAVIGFIILGGAGVAYWLHTRDRISTDDAQVDGHIDYIASRISGSVAEVLVENGNFV